MERLGESFARGHKEARYVKFTIEIYIYEIVWFLAFANFKICL